VINFGGHTILALDIENEILGLDYVSEVMVVGVDSEKTGQGIAAAVVLTRVSLHSIRFVFLSLNTVLTSCRTPHV
jgi:acyl-coenzyme A synthetase/AMP-(fatty) acid ligase